MKKAARSWIDKSDSAGHVRQHFLVENNFTLQPLLGFHLALIKPTAQPGEDRCEDNQPGCQQRHSPKQIMNRFVSQRFRLFHYCHPTGIFDWTERVKVPVLLEMSRVAFTDFLHQRAVLGRSHTGARLKIIGKKRNAVLIENFEQKPVGKIDRGQTPANSFYEDRVANVA